MALTDEQLGKMLTDIEWIREDLQKGRDTFSDHNERIAELEKNQAVITTKLGAFVITGLFICTIVGNAVIHLFQKVIAK